MRLFFFALITLLLASCQQKELCYDHNHVPKIQVTFDWTDNPDANPSSMMVYLYPRTPGESVLKREFAGKDGGVTQAKAGVSYTILAFGSDAKNTYFKELEGENTLEVTSMNATTVGATAIPASEMPRAEGAEDQRWSMPADSTLTGTFQSYGDSQVADTPNYLLFYAVLTDGSKWQYLYDVTQQVEAAGDSYDVYITIAHLPVPKKSGGSNGGIHPDVNDWDNIDVPIPM